MPIFRGSGARSSGVARHNFVGRGSGFSLDPDIALWLTTVNLAGGLVLSSDLVLANNFALGMKAINLWSLLDNWWFTALGNVSTAAGKIAALTDIRSRVVGTEIAGPLTWTNQQGVTGNGTSQGIDLGTIGGSKSQYTLNSASNMFYSLINYAARNNVDMGNSDNVNSFGEATTLRYGDGNLYFALNDANGDTGRAAPTDTRGFWVNTRVSSTTAIIYQNGGSAFASNGQVSTAVPTHNFGIGGAYSPAGLWLEWSTNQFAMCGIGGGLSAAQQAQIATLANNFARAQGFNVF
jgi:hypothetical protein